MAIIGLQRRFREVGRIRMGVQTTARSGRRVPKKIANFRLTSADQRVIEAAAATYGGTAKAWDNDGKDEFEVITTATELRIALPPNPTDLGFSQHYEQWANGYCTRRCNGERDGIHDRPCDCDPDDRMCKATTRLTVLLPDIAGLGTWRLESHGWNAAVELGGAVDLIEQLAGVRSIVPARLRLDQREKRKLVDGKAEVFKFAVPVIDLDVSIQGVRQLAATSFNAVGSVDDLSAIDAPSTGWKPVPAAEAPLALTVEAQVKEHEQARPPAKKRANAAAPLPPTGRPPRTAAQAAGTTCDICGKDYGSESLVPNPDKSPGASRFVHRSHTAAETGGGGTSDEAPAPPASPVEPAPTGRPPDRMSPKMRAKSMAMLGKLFPVDATKMTGPEADDYRRQITIDICTALGSPGYTSRGDIDMATGKLLIDTLQAIEDGDVTFDVDTRVLSHTATGEPIGFSKGES